MIFGSQGTGINPDRIVFDGAHEKVRQRGTERVHIVFVRKLEKDPSNPQAGQLGSREFESADTVAVSQGEIERLRVFGKIEHRKSGARGLFRTS